MATMTDAERRFADRTAKLVRAVHAARRLAGKMRQVDRGVYAIDPEAVLALRSSVAAAELVLIHDERISDKWR
jgi:hypothetical protein